VRRGGRHFRSRIVSFQAFAANFQVSSRANFSGVRPSGAGGGRICRRGSDFNALGAKICNSGRSPSTALAVMADCPRIWSDYPPAEEGALARRCCDSGRTRHERKDGARRPHVAPLKVVVCVHAHFREARDLHADVAPGRVEPPLADGAVDDAADGSPARPERLRDLMMGRAGNEEAENGLPPPEAFLRPSCASARASAPGEGSSIMLICLRRRDIG
jgi:hypothetical protein